MVGTKRGKREFSVLLVAGAASMERNNIRASDNYVLSQNKKAGWFDRHPAFSELVNVAR
jgi:hypothetical protein